MSRKDTGRRHHRGRRSRKKAGIISNIILVIAVVVFCVSGFQLLKIGKGYLDGRSEYEKVRDLAVTNPEEKEGFRVDFNALLEVNPDTVGWIRFYPEPSQINYPIVQGQDNDEYLHQTFSANENTLGAIFLNVDNKADFSDRNSIIYGHRMKDGSMFRHLQDYEEKSFWEENPYFYIYTPDGKEITYQIYSYAVVDATSDVYLTSFADDGAYQEFLNMTKGVSAYDTGVEVTAEDTIVTLSTCTSASDDHRIIVQGVKEKEVVLED